MPSVSGLLFTALSLLLAWLLWNGRERGNGVGQGRWRLRLRSLIPPLLIAVCLPSGCANDRFDTLRLRVRGVSYVEADRQLGTTQATTDRDCEAYRNQPGTVFLVGHDRRCVDVVVQNDARQPVDGPLLRTIATPEGGGRIELATIASGGNTMVAAFDRDGARTYVGALPIGDGDSFCIGGCGNAANWLTFSDGGITGPGGGAPIATTQGGSCEAVPGASGPVVLPVRPGTFGWLRPLGPSRRVYRLSNLLRSRDAAEGCEFVPARNERGEVATSFMFQTGGFGGNGWQIMLTDPGAQLRRAGGQPEQISLTEAIDLENDRTQGVAFLALRSAQLSELRSIHVGYTVGAQPDPRRRFALTLDTPEIVPIGNCASPLIRLTTRSSEALPGTAEIAALGIRSGSALYATPTLPIGGNSLCANVDGIAQTADEGRPGEARMLFGLDRMSLPWLLLLFAAAVALVVHVSSEGVWLHRPLDGQILTIVQYLLAVRMLIGIEGAFDQATLNWRSIYLDIGIAMLTLPMILIAVRRARGPQAIATAIALILFVLLGVGALTLWLGRPDATGLLFVALAIGGLALHAFLAWRGRFRRPGPRGPLQRLLDRPPTFWLPLLATIVAVRVLLGLFYFQERSFGITLSAVYIPLLVVGFAAILADADAKPDKRTGMGLYYLGALLIAVGLVAEMINDVGFALVHVPPIAGLALWRMIIWWREPAPAPAPAEPADEMPAEAARPVARHRLVWSALWSAPVVGLIAGYIGLWAFIALLTPPPGDQAPPPPTAVTQEAGQPRPDATLDAQIAYAIGTRQNNAEWLRLRAVFAPSQIDRIGNSDAAVQLDQSLLLRDLTDTMFGQGWLAPIDLGSFLNQATHLSDYLSSSHIMAPFGRIGALSLLLVLAAGAGAAVAGRVGRPASWPKLAGALALWTLFGAAAYMILANLLLVPFTGRNIYLLSASSGGDLVEGMALLLLARIGLGHRLKS